MKKYNPHIILFFIFLFCNKNKEPIDENPEFQKKQYPIKIVGYAYPLTTDAKIYSRPGFESKFVPINNINESIDVYQTHIPDSKNPEYLWYKAGYKNLVGYIPYGYEY